MIVPHVTLLLRVYLELREALSAASAVLLTISDFIKEKLLGTGFSVKKGVALLRCEYRYQPDQVPRDPVIAVCQAVVRKKVEYRTDYG